MAGVFIQMKYTVLSVADIERRLKYGFTVYVCGELYEKVVAEIGYEPENLRVNILVPRGKVYSQFKKHCHNIGFFDLNIPLFI